jgi:cell wall-associated NlpC family hydrolase
MEAKRMGGRLVGGVAVVAVFWAAAGLQSAIADSTDGATASAVALEVLEPGQAALVVGAMPTGSELKAGGARLKIADYRSTAKAGRWVAVVGGGQALARVYGGSLFGGDVTFGQASASVQVVGDPASTTGTSQVTHLKLFGRPVDLQPGASVALGDWGSLTLGSPPPSASAATKATQAAITIDVTTEHAGLPAGTRVIVATVEVTSPPPPPPPPTGSGGVGGGDRGGLGGASGGSRRSTHKQPAGSHPKTSPPSPLAPPARHHRAFPHRHLATHPRILPAQARLRIVAWAASQIGWPYVWGGESQAEGGFDCSGLVDFAYASAGFPLPDRPTAQVLWQLSQPIRRAQLRPGDLVFLRTASGYAYHVAVYAGDGQVIVASHHGAPVARQPLTSSPWDAYGRIWAHGSLRPRPDLVTAHAKGERPTPRHVLRSSGDAVVAVAPTATALTSETPRQSAPPSRHNPPRHGSPSQPQTWGEPRPPHPGIAANPRHTH